MHCNGAVDGCRGCELGREECMQEHGNLVGEQVHEDGIGVPHERDDGQEHRHCIEEHDECTEGPHKEDGGLECGVDNQMPYDLGHDAHILAPLAWVPHMLAHEQTYRQE